MRVQNMRSRSATAAVMPHLKRRLLALALCLCMVMTLLPLTALAVPEPVCICTVSCDGADDVNWDCAVCEETLGRRCNYQLVAVHLMYGDSPEDSEPYEGTWDGVEYPRYVSVGSEPVQLSSSSYPTTFTLAGANYTRTTGLGIEDYDYDQNEVIIDYYDTITIPAFPATGTDDAITDWFSTYESGIRLYFTPSSSTPSPFDSAIAYLEDNRATLENTIYNGRTITNVMDTLRGRLRIVLTGLNTALAGTGVTAENLTVRSVEYTPAKFGTYYEPLGANGSITFTVNVPVSFLGAGATEPLVLFEGTCELYGSNYDSHDNPWSYFSFSNSRSDFFPAGTSRSTHTYVADAYFSHLEAFMRTNYPRSYQSDIQFLKKKSQASWIGSCYGFSVVEALYNTGALDITNYDYNATSLSDVDMPKNNRNVLHLLNYFFLTQYVTAMQNEVYYMDEAVGRGKILELAKNVTDTDGDPDKHRYMFCYSFQRDGYYYGHAFMIDGGVKNEDGSYTLTGQDNRYHGYTVGLFQNGRWYDTEEPITVEVNISADGTSCVVHMDATPPVRGGYVYNDIPAFDETVVSFEYISDFRSFERIIPGKYPVMEPIEVTEYVKVIGIPTDNQNFIFRADQNEIIDSSKDKPTENKHWNLISAPAEVEGNRSEDVEVNVGVRGLMTALNDPTESTEYNIENSAGGKIGGSYSFIGATYLSADVTSADEVNMQPVNPTVGLTGNQGEFSLSVSNDGGTVFSTTVSGSATGDIEIISGTNSVTINAPAGAYNVTFYDQNADSLQTRSVTVGASGTATVTYTRPSGGGGGGGSSSSSNAVLSFQTNGGSTITSVTEAIGTTVDLSGYTPTRAGYTFTGWYSDSALTNRVTSIRLDASQTVYAGWQAVDPNVNPFTDVRSDDWFYDNVMYVYRNGLMTGTSNTTFSPNEATTRAMMATTLWRLEGSPAVSGGSSFTDVASGLWYSNAIVWATQNGIARGYGAGLFGPNDEITREQLATFFYNYAVYKGETMTTSGSLAAFTDRGAVSDWAEASVTWAVGSGLMNGKDNSTLDPKGNATRAEIAAMLNRYADR